MIPDRRPALAGVVCLLGVAGCTYPVLTHGVRPAPGVSLGGSSVLSILQSDSPTTTRTILFPDAAGHIAAGWGGTEPDDASLRLTYQLSVTSGSSFDIYTKFPGRLFGRTWSGLGLQVLTTAPRRGVIPYAMIGWPLGDGTLSVSEGGAFVRSASRERGSSVVALTTVSYEPDIPERAHVEAHFFLGFALGHQTPKCYALAATACTHPVAWLGTSFGLRPSPRRDWR
ncbi:MAG TPA: hypothetical protein VGI92_12670 [Gemmatimonadales bacterium]|jgi:hypothetical protein